jgi:hypothetical protein
VRPVELAINLKSAKALGLDAAHANRAPTKGSNSLADVGY